MVHEVRIDPSPSCEGIDPDALPRTARQRPVIRRGEARDCGRWGEEAARQRMSLRKIAAELAARGHLTAYGRPYVASAVQSMLG
jgi:hypothetical protein